MSKRTSRVIGLAAVVAVGMMLAAAGAAPPAEAADPIKQSRSGICWCPGTGNYDQVTNFTAFDSIEECLAADGRHPKRGQGDCPSPQDRIATLEAELAEVHAALALAEAQAGPSAACEKWLSWLEDNPPADWEPVGKTTWAGHHIVKKEYVPPFVRACRE